MFMLKKSQNVAVNKLTRIICSAILVLVFLSVFLPSVATAQANVPDPIDVGASGGKMTLDNPLGNTDSINGLIKKILEGVIKIGLPLIAIAIIYSGFLFVTAQGKPGDIEKAKSALLYTLIGAAILLGAWAIAQLISETVLSL